MALLRSFNYEFPGLLDRIPGRDSNEIFRSVTQVGYNVPAVNILENNESFLLQVAAPGFQKEDFSIQVENFTLTLSAKKQEGSDKQEQKKYNQREFNYSSWKRTFALPKTVEIDGIQAQYENGILSVLVPKKEEAKVKPSRTIEIK